MNLIIPISFFASGLTFCEKLKPIDVAIFARKSDLILCASYQTGSLTTVVRRVIFKGPTVTGKIEADVRPPQALLSVLDRVRSYVTGVGDQVILFLKESPGSNARWSLIDERRGYIPLTRGGVEAHWYSALDEHGRSTSSKWLVYPGLLFPTQMKVTGGKASLESLSEELSALLHSHKPDSR